MNKEIDKKALTWYLIFKICISAILETLYIVTSGKLGFLILLLMWTPGITAVCIKYKYYKGQSLLGMKLCSLKYLFAGIVIPIIYLSISYGIYWMCFKGTYLGTSYLADQIRKTYGFQAPDLFTILIILIIGFISSILSAEGEEIGWRGFMYPVMERIWKRKTALIFSGGLWAMWHMPLIITGLYEADTILSYGLIMFVIEIIGIAIILAWLRMASNSVLPAIMLHAGHNLFNQQIFRGITNSGNSGYYVGEKGIITVIIVIGMAIIAMILWKMKEKVTE